MKKKIFGLLTTLVMVVSLVGVLPAVNVSATSGVKSKLDSFISKYPSGSKWTGSFDGGKQCYGFAKLVIYNIFGKSNSGGYTYRTWKYDGTPTSGMTVIGSITSYSSSNVKKLLSKAKCGDVLQFDSTKQHSMIVYAVESDGVVIYDCNWDSNCGIRKKKCSFGTWSGRNSSRLTLLHSDNYSKIEGKSHTVNSSYGKNVTAYLKNPNSKVPVYTSCGVIASGHYISGKDPVTIKEVYTDGCCKVSYKTDSGSTKTYISKISYFNIHVHTYTKRLYEPGHPHRISERCSCGASRWTNQYYKLKTCEKCWDIKFKSSPTSINVKVSENATLSLSLEGSIYPETAKFDWKYNDSIIEVTRNGNKFNIKGKKEGKCNLVFTAYTDKSLSKIITKLSIPVTVTSHKHTYTSKITKQPTCTATGVRTYTCSVCKETKTETIAKTGHKYTTKVISPTCTTQGYTLYTCSKCGDKYKSSYTNDKGHNYGSWTTTKAATCTSEGTKTRKCSACGNTETQTIAKMSHSYSANWTIDKQATCSAEGSKSNHCTVCGAKKDITLISKIAHNYTSSVTKQPTCTATGVRTYTCSLCSDSYSETIPETGHKYEDIVHKATCTEQGHTEHMCLVCGDTYKDDYTELIAHKYSNGFCTVCGVKLSDYKEQTTSTPADFRLNNISITQPITTAKVTKLKLTAKKKKLNVKWKKVSGAKGYQVMSATNKKFTKNKKTVNVKKNKVTLKKLKSKKKYFVKVRAYKTVNGKKVYGSWSKVISKKAK